MLGARVVAGLGIVVAVMLRTGRAAADTLSRNLRSSVGETPITNFELRPSALHVHGGYGTPVGFVGVELEHNLVKYFGLAAGGGYSTGGPQGAVEVLVRPFVWRRQGILFIPGVSVGRFDGQELNFPGQGDSRAARRYRVELGVWLNIGIGYDHRTDRGFVLRAYTGYGFLMNQSELRCYSRVVPEGPCDDPPQLVFPYSGVAFGRAF